MSAHRTHRYSTMSGDQDGNQYIPKYIQNVPWYYDTGSKDKNDALAHHRKNPNEATVDQSLPQVGQGIKDEFQIVDGYEVRVAEDYAAKRDRWHGHTAAEWEEILEKWDTIKKAKGGAKQDQNDSDDTDYELELEELGLDRKVLNSGHIEDPLEKSIRDRRDVPAYIRAINANQGGKIRLGKDSTAGVTNDDSEFVKESKDVTELRQMQKFAWEQNKQYEEKKLKELYQAQLASLNDPYAEVDSTVPVDLDLSVEASPTLMMLKNKENEEKKRAAAELRKQLLMNRYGS